MSMPHVEPKTLNKNAYWEATQQKKKDLLSFSLIFYFLYFTLFFSFSYIPFLLFQH